MNILITSGATREPVDGVRFLSNVSSGRTGAAIADALWSRGHQITLLHGTGAVLPECGGIDKEAFGSTADLDLRLKERLSRGRWDAVIHLAAVSDYHVAEVSGADSAGRAPDTGSKISSSDPSNAELTLTLRKNPKVLNRIKGYSGGTAAVIGFKLTQGASPEERARAVERLFEGGDVDLVVHNDLAEIRAGRHTFTVVDETAPRGKARSPDDLSGILENEIKGGGR